MRRPRSATTPTRSCTRPRRSCATRATRCPTDESAAVEGPLDDLKKALTGSDVEAIKSADREADGGQPELQPEALRGGGPRRQRRRHVGVGSDDSGASGAADDEIVDAEIVDEK